MTERRPTRSTSDLRGTPLSNLQLPSHLPPHHRPGRGRGSPRPNSPLPEPSAVLFDLDSAETSKESQNEIEERFEDASSDTSPNTSSTMAGLPPPPGPDATTEEIRRYAECLRESALAFSNSLASTTRLLEQSLTVSSNRGASHKKPELPPFDMRNIESWIRRVENAFLRVNITDPKLKFAHLESVIAVDLHPTINQLFNGTADQAHYEQLLEFLRKRYGRTHEQQVQSAIEGVRRNGRMPTDLVADFDDKMGKVTLADIKKAHLLNELPRSVREGLSQQIEKSDYKELAKIADTYFNRDGTLRSNNTVNSISSSQSSLPNTGASNAQTGAEGLLATQYTRPSPAANFTQAFASEDNAQGDGTVNFVNRQPRSNNSNGTRGGNGSNNNNNNRRDNSRSRSNNQRSQGSANRSSSRPNRSSSRSNANNPNFCWYHNHYQENATNCQPPCTFSSGNNQRSGNGRGGRR